MSVADDIRTQAQWELALERYEKRVAEEKEKILKEASKGRFFPWRIRFINVNKES